MMVTRKSSGSKIEGYSDEAPNCRVGKRAVRGFESGLDTPEVTAAVHRGQMNVGNRSTN